MDDIETKAIFDAADQYLGYFSENDAELSKLLTKLSKLEAVEDAQIDAITRAPAGRGTQHYLIDHLANEISIQTQKQSILKDKRDIKANALNIALKSANGDDISDASEVIGKLQMLIKERGKAADALVAKTHDNENSYEIDEEIEKKLAADE